MGLFNCCRRPSTREPRPEFRQPPSDLTRGGNSSLPVPVSRLSRRPSSPLPAARCCRPSSAPLPVVNSRISHIPIRAQTPRGSGGSLPSPAPRRRPTECALTGGHTRPVHAAVPSPSWEESKSRSRPSARFCPPHSLAPDELTTFDSQLSYHVTKFLYRNGSIGIS